MCVVLEAGPGGSKKEKPDLIVREQHRGVGVGVGVMNSEP